MIDLDRPMQRGDWIATLGALGIRPSRALGQNFLIEPNVVERIVAAARLYGRAPTSLIMHARGIEHSTHGVNNCLACINLALARGQVGKPGGGTAYPGDVGNYAVAAHRVTHGEPLRHMPDLRPGDKVIVETVDASYVYELDTNPNDLVISFTGIWVLDPLPDNPRPGGPEPEQVPGQRLITLTTCSELFHTDNRMIAFGHLVKAEKKTVRVPAG